MTAAHKWHDAVFERDDYRCASAIHDHRCPGRAEVAHHIVYRRFLYKEAMWLVDNGIALSEYCHLLAHSMHNLNIDEERLIAAVDAVNVAQPKFKRPYFVSKGIV